MLFDYPQKVLFRHCDPAGIVFYPRYFEMMNDCVEAFFEERAALPFSRLHAEGGGMPTADITTRFVAPSRLGDALTLEFRLTCVGRTSLGTTLRATCAGQLRFKTTSTLVLVDRTGRPTRWPEAVRAELNSYLEDCDNAAQDHTTQ